ncbi:protein Psp1p [Monosporozyma servazzii]
MELPSINSTTSISDNPDLRNHYEKLLFNNQSGNSLSDLPNTTILKNSVGNAHLYQRINSIKRLDNFDFISGFKNLNPTQSPNDSPYQSYQSDPRIPDDSTNPLSQNNSAIINDSPYHLSQNDSRMTPDVSPYSQYGQQRHLSFPGNQQQQQQQQQLRHLSFPENNQPQQRTMASQHSTWNQDNNNNNNNRRFSTNTNNSISNSSSNYLVSSNTNSLLPSGYVSTDNIMLHQPLNSLEQVRKHHSLSNGEINGISNRWNGQENNNATSNNNSNSNVNEVAIEDGLLLINGKYIASSNELYQLYGSCGNNYFSSSVVYPLVDYMKELTYIPATNVVSDNRKNNVLQFLTFLQNCNSNFVNQFHNSGKLYNSSQNQNLNSSRGPESVNLLQPKGLVLVALKNGKLELLSTPHNTNLHLKRGDLVIIDGDRGKDLVQVVEANVNMNLALFSNFLKKKVHFDSLITAKYQHFPNDKFIQTLINSKNGSGEKLNTKLYDIIELTQLIIPSKQVLRFATPWEVMTNLQHKFQDELKALHIAQIKLQNLNNSRMNNTDNGEVPIDKKPLNIKILNSEFQFDRNKLTFYYICEERNDFRELIKELFKFYKTRIWLCAIPNNLNIDSKYYDIERKELTIYEQMIRSQQSLDLNGSNSFSLYNPTTSTNEALSIPPLSSIELDNFQIGIYKELINELF